MSDVLVPFFQAAYDGTLDALKRAPKHALDAKHPVHGSTLLYTACRFGRTACAKWLLGQGASVNEPNTAANRSTPLHGAAFGGHATIVNMLLEHGADASAENAYDETPLDNAKDESTDVSAAKRKACVAALEKAAASTMEDDEEPEDDDDEEEEMDCDAPSVDWHYDVRGDGNWTEYAACDAATIESLWTACGGGGKSKPVRLSFSKYDYVFDFSAMQQRNQKTGKLRTICRGDLPAKPPPPPAAPAAAPAPPVPKTGALAGMTKGILSGMTVKELQELAKSAGLLTAGPKKDLVGRLSAAAAKAGTVDKSGPAPDAPPAKKAKKAAPAPAAAAPAAAGDDDDGIEALRSATFTLETVAKDTPDFWDLEEKFHGCLQGRNDDYVKNRIAAGKKPLTFILRSAEKVCNSVLESRFAKRTATMKAKYPGDGKMTRERTAFHGTSAKNLNSILRTSLLRFKHKLNPCKTQSDDGWFGTNRKGVYVSRYADYTLKYSNSGEALEKADRCKIIMFKCLPGKSKHIPETKEGMEPTVGFDSHSSPEYLEWYLFNEDQLCPTYVLEVQAKEDTRTAADDGDDDA
eukprot:TRINITY_DN39573_c0_g1_i1.p1 TRINITY_DN39573_c0_g1~~TRINITY_DN39573_c0_g1_i1.p1  ORF type:complete len:577 (+),score=148.78 TRINITY_DN39573_c0_g1_i1:56-1786(+)